MGEPLHPSSILAVCGLRTETSIAAGPGVAVVAGGGDASQLALRIDAALLGGAKAVVSFGIAGGLAPGLRPGSLIVADCVHDDSERWVTDAKWRARLLADLPDACSGGLAGVDQAVAGRAGKAALYRHTNALAVDMESHIAARIAALHHVPFVALRVVADPAERSLPDAALVGMRSNGSVDVGAVLLALARRPSDLPALIQTARDARAAFATLRRIRHAIGAVMDYRAGGDAGTRDSVPPMDREGRALSGIVPEQV